MTIENILKKSLLGERLNNQEALTLLNSPDWYSIAQAAHEKRNQLHSPEKVTYAAFRVLNYTNFCNIDCTFCSFKDDVESDRGYTLTLEQIAEKAEHTLSKGVYEIFFQGGVNPSLPLKYYTDAFEILSQKYRMNIRGLSPVEVMRLAEKEGLSVTQLLSILKKSGLNSVPGAGAEILTESMRQILSPKKLSAEDWCSVMGDAHKIGLKGSSNIVFGSVETPKDVVEHFNFIREQQDKTGGFLSFIPWVFQPQTKRFKVRYVKKWEYLRLLAVSRLYFDNIPHIEASILVMGKDIAEMALHCGANDMSSIVLEENVLKSYGIRTLEGAEKFISNAGFTPQRRTMDYEPLTVASK